MLNSSALLSLVKQARAAKGIRDRSYYGNIARDIHPGDVLDYMRQKHDALIRGPHYDFRFGKGKATGLHSWATNYDYPEPGKGIPVIQQPTHKFSYLGWSGEIPKGKYGGGKVAVKDIGKALVTDINPNEVHLTTASNKEQMRLALIRMLDKQWKLIRPKTMEDKDAVKPKYKYISPPEMEEYISNLPDNVIAQPKIDGALNFISLKDKPEFLSHRKSVKTNEPIVHTERFFAGRPKFEVPKDYKNSLLAAEIFGVRDGKVIPQQELGGLLNATLENSLAKQKADNVTLKAMLFDIFRKGNEPIDRKKVPYSERRKYLEELIGSLPKDKFILPEQAIGKEQLRALLEKIKSGKHPLTQEGIVVYPEGKNPAKLKLFNEYDVYIKDMFDATKGSKYEGKAVGGFRYSLNPDGPIIGHVGGGISDALREDMFKRPEEYIGRIARIKSLGQFQKTKAYRHPNLIALHEG